MSLITIIIPTFNCSVTVTNTINSILSQSFRDYELLIIDGSSIESTLELLRRLASTDQRITLFSEKDEGIYDAMNKGITLAKGNWIYFLGSDDTLYDDQVLADLSKVLVRCRAKLVYGNVMIKGSNDWKKDGTIYNGEFNLCKLLDNNICHQSIFYHKSLFNQLGYFNNNFKVFADHDFNLRCFGAKINSLYIERIVASFSIGGASSTLFDKCFEESKGELIVKYFYYKVHKNEFIKYRLDVKKAASNPNLSFGRLRRLYFYLSYLYLKALSLIVPRT